MVTKEIFGTPVTAKDHVLIAAVWPEPTEWIENVQKEHPGLRITYYHLKISSWEVYTKGGSHVPAELFKDVTIFVTMHFMPNPEDAPKLEICTVLSAGTNHIQNSRIWRETDITITNSVGIHGPQIAEWVICMILAHNRKFRLLEKWQREHHWGSFSEVRVHDVVKRKIGIFSYGSIGRQIGRVSHALGMEVHAYTATPKDTPEKRKDHGYIVPGTGDADGIYPVKWYSGLDRKSFHDFLRVGFDVLVLSVPLTEQTRHLMGKEEFDILKETKKNPFFVNISRGPIVVTDELEKALRLPEEEGGLTGAALDVVDPEPLPKDHTLWDVPNVFISPHMTGAGDHYLDRCLDILAINLRLRAEGKKMINIVDKKRGY